MIFSVGNILTLGLVIIILAVFRQLDRNNRSLEKVKKYSDKIKEELDGFVETKAVELKDLSIELGVHQKAAVEVLKRIQNIEEGLNSRAGEVEKISKRIGEYDRALEELAKMTSRVDENLKRIQNESEFVDTVGRRLKEATGRIVQLERTLPGLRNEFDKQNSEQLKQIMRAVIKDTEGLVKSIQQEVKECDKKVDSFSGFIQQLEARRDTFNVRLAETLQNTFNTFIKKGEAAEKELSEKFNARLDDLLENADIKAGGITDSLKKEFST
ncbi:MAG: hypothetical protein AB1798_16660, partial [Spirochaetota bacterium]